MPCILVIVAMFLSFNRSFLLMLSTRLNQKASLSSNVAWFISKSWTLVINSSESCFTYRRGGNMAIYYWCFDEAGHRIRALAAAITTKGDSRPKRWVFTLPQRSMKHSVEECQELRSREVSYSIHSDVTCSSLQSYRQREKSTPPLKDDPSTSSSDHQMGK